VIHRTPRPVYKLENLNKQLIDGQFYEKELTPVRITRFCLWYFKKELMTSRDLVCFSTILTAAIGNHQSFYSGMPAKKRRSPTMDGENSSESKPVKAPQLDMYLIRTASILCSILRESYFAVSSSYILKKLNISLWDSIRLEIFSLQSRL